MYKVTFSVVEVFVKSKTFIVNESATKSDVK